MLNEPSDEVSEGLKFMVFGKHQAWADHIDDIGIFSKSLFSFKKWLYIDGIRSAIESGNWRNEPLALDEWNHRIVMKGETGWIFALCMQSPDAKGRSDYPLVVALHIIADVFPENVSPLWDVLAEFKEALPRCHNQDALRDASRSCYEASVEVITDVNPLDQDGSNLSIRNQFLKQTQYGDSGEGITRIFYRLYMDLKLFLVDKNVNVTRFFRIPTSSAFDSQVLYYFELLYSQLSKKHMLGWVESLDGGFADLFVGLADAQQVVNMKYPRSLAPALSEVTFNWSDSERSQIESFLELYLNTPDLTKISLFTKNGRHKKKFFYR